MRIMLLGPPMIDTHTQRFVQMLLDAGHTVFFLSKDRTGLAESEKLIFIEFLEILIPWTRPYRFMKMLRIWRETLRLRIIWQKYKPDIVHVIFITEDAFYCALARLHPLILTALGGEINNLFDPKYSNREYSEMIAKALRNADFITADTQEILTRCDMLAEQSLNSSLFYFGIDLEIFYPRALQEKTALREKLGIPSNTKVVLSPRRLTPSMNHNIILKAFSQYTKSGEVEAVLVFRKFGYFSYALEDELRDQAVSLGINEKVIWLKEIDYDQLPILYSLADLVINIPERDGLPVTLFEVSACMTPIITSDLPAYHGYCSEGAYFFVGVEDTKGIEKLMNLILESDAKEIKNSIQMNFDLVVRTADQKRCFSVIEKIYKDLAKHHKSRLSYDLPSKHNQ
jgi:glycosyltransferase involved in cell wall biosynthesis